MSGSLSLRLPRPRVRPPPPRGQFGLEVNPTSVLWRHLTFHQSVNGISNEPGVGHPVIDLGTPRWDLSVLSGGGADDVLTAWQEGSGLTLPNGGRLPTATCWALAWIADFHGQGRRDLSLERVRGRRNEFVRRALDVLG